MFTIQRSQERGIRSQHEQMMDYEELRTMQIQSAITNGNFVSPLVMEFLSVKSLLSFGQTSKYHYYQVLPNEIKRRKKLIANYEKSVKAILSGRKNFPLGRHDFYEAKYICKKARMLIGPPPRLRLKKMQYCTQEHIESDWMYENNSDSPAERFWDTQICYCCRTENEKYDPFFEERIKMVPKLCDRKKHQPTLYMLPDCFYVSPNGSPLSTWVPTELTLALLKNMALTIWSAAELTDNSSLNIFGEQSFPSFNSNNEDAIKFRRLTRYQALPFSECEMTLFFFRIAASDIAKSNMRAQICLHDVIKCADTLHAIKNKNSFPIDTGEYYFDLSFVESTVTDRTKLDSISDISDSLSDESMSSCSL